MTRKVVVIIILLMFSLLLSPITARATDDSYHGELIDAIDFSALEEYFATIDNGDTGVFGDNIVQFIKDVSQGKDKSVLEGIWTLLVDSVFSSLSIYVSVFGMVAAVILLTGLLQGIKSDFVSESVGSIIDFSVACLSGCVVLVSFVLLAQKTIDFTTRINNLTLAVFPILFTLLSTLGATTTVVSFQASASLFTSLSSWIINSVILPLAVACSTVAVVSSLTKGGVSRANKIFFSLIKYVLYTTFFVFSAAAAMQGIMVSVQDSVSIRMARFSLNKYVPIIGGYLSSGFNYLFASAVLIKNSVGLACVLLLLIAAMPLLIEIIMFNLGVKLLTVISATLGSDKTTTMLDGVNKGGALILSSVVGVAVCVLVFVAILISSCNSVV